MNFTGLMWMVVLLLANGFFVAAEFAYIAARRNVLEQRNTRPARAAVKLSEELSMSLAAAQLGITIASLLLGFVAEPAVATILERAIHAVVDISDELLHTISLVIALSIVVFLHMVIGEMAPKNIAISAPERSALAMAIPFRAFIFVFRPAIAAFNWTANALLRLVGVEPADRLEEAHSAQDLAIVIAAGQREGVIEAFAHRLLTGAILLAERDAYDVMVPRPDIDALPSTASAAAVEQVVRETGHSRIPIHTGDIDDVIGFVHAKDLLVIDDDRADDPIPASAIRPILVFPESANVRYVLTEMQRTRNHLGLVIDEHGGTAGLISLEDIAEELVGEIRDEHDPSALPSSRVLGGKLLVLGGTRVDQLVDLGIEVEPGDYETVGGFVMDQLGRIPRVGDLVEIEGSAMRVTRMDGRRVTEVEISSVRGIDD